MNADLLASIEMTAGAAVAIAVLAIGFGEHVTTRARIATGLAAWFMLVTVMAATKALHDEHGLGVAGIGVAVMLPIVILSVGVLRSAALHKARARSRYPRSSG
jgi:hypothetical protein